MRKALVTGAALALLAVPMAPVAGANPLQWIKENGVPQSSCEFQEMIGVVNVMPCEGYDD
jgi:hypothetical protein